jgi:hypothetical protein
MHTLYRWRSALMVLILGFAFLWSPTAAHAQDDSQWAYRLGNGLESQATAVSYSNAGEVFVAGVFRGNMDFDPGPGEQVLNGGSVDSGYIAKYGPAGNLIWAQLLKGNDHIRIHDIVVDGMNQIGVVGSFRGEADLDPGPELFRADSKGSDDIFLLRLLPDGTLDWAWTGGSTDSDAGIAVATDSRFGLYITGSFEGTMFVESDSPSYEMESAGGDDVFAARFNNAGRLFWVRAFGGSDDDEPTDIALDAANNVYLVGTFNGKADLDPTWTSIDLQSYGNSDIFVTILSVVGNWIWSTQLGGTGRDGNARVLAEPDGTYYVSGEFQGSGDFDRIGDGGTINSRGERDVFLTRYTPQHNFEWVFGIGSGRTDSIAGIDQDGFGSIYLLGSFEETVDFDPGPGQTLLTSSGSDDVFVAKYTRQGELRQVRNLVNPQDDAPSALAIDHNSNVIIAGEFRSTLDLGDGLTVSTGQPENVYNVFLARYARDTWTPLPLRAYLPGVVRDDNAR